MPEFCLTSDNKTEPDTDCPFCRASHQLDTLTADTAVMCLIPGLSATDITLLQRAIHVAFNSDDHQYREDAKQLLDWLCSKKSLTEKHFGSSHPNAFAQVLAVTPPEKRNCINTAWQNISPILNTGRLPAPKANTLNNVSVWKILYDTYIIFKERK